MPDSAPLAWSLFKQPESLTEVFFSDHTALPTAYFPSETYTISFTIVNKEGRSLSYPIEVTQEGENGRIILARDTMAVENGQAKASQISITYSNSGPSARVSLSLPEQNQTLQYLVKRRDS